MEELARLKIIDFTILKLEFYQEWRKGVVTRMPEPHKTGENIEVAIKSLVLLNEVLSAAEETFNSIEYEGIEHESPLLYEVVKKIKELNN